MAGMPGVTNSRTEMRSGAKVGTVAAPESSPAGLWGVRAVAAGDIFMLVSIDVAISWRIRVHRVALG
jgi:hypothetical protein